MSSILFATALFAHRFAAHLDAVGMVHQPVENTVGQRWVPDLLVPLGHRQLAGQDDGARRVAILTDFQEVAPTPSSG